MLTKVSATLIPLSAEKCLNAGSQYAACGLCSNNINQTGWATLEIITNPYYSDEQQAFAAGMVVNVLYNNYLLFAL